MILDDNLIIIHAYLCADGYVVTNNKLKYYRIGLRNTNLTLLEDFQKRFEKIFNLKPAIRKDGRCEKNSKEIYEKLTKKFGSFYCHHWSVPKMNAKQSKLWLRAFFDCEGWVFCKTHQNRHIGLDSVNGKGITKIIELLNNLGIDSIRKFNEKREIHRIFIYGKKNLIKFRAKIGFLHPDKAEKLNKTIEDYVEYIWDFPKDKKRCRNFVYSTLKNKIRIREPYLVRIISKEQINLEKLKDYIKKFYDIQCLVNKRVNGLGTIYYELNINRRLEVAKLIKLKLIPNLFKLE